jgi:hypothetical protein
MSGVPVPEVPGNGIAREVVADRDRKRRPNSPPIAVVPGDELRDLETRIAEG